MRTMLHFLVLMIVYGRFGQCPNNSNGNNHWKNNVDEPILHSNGQHVGKRVHKTFIFGMGWHKGLLTNNIYNWLGGPRAQICIQNRSPHCIWNK
jgi:hypothetical protein